MPEEQDVLQVKLQSVILCLCINESVNTSGIKGQFRILDMGLIFSNTHAVFVLELWKNSVSSVHTSLTLVNSEMRPCNIEC